MGYCIFQRDADFVIKRKNHQYALNAIVQLHGREPIHDKSGSHFAFVDTEDFLTAPNLVEALHAWRWQPEVTVDGDIIDIAFTGEKHGDDDILFAAIARYVEPESYIEMIGEDGKTWRWIFDGVSAYKVAGVTIFTEPTIEDRLDLDELDGWIVFRKRE